MRAIVWKARPATSKTSFKSGPDMSRLIFRPPPKPLPNKDVWKTKPRLPGSWKIARRIIGMSSFVRVGSTAAPAAMVNPRRITNQKRLILTGPSAGWDMLSGDVKFGRNLWNVFAAISRTASRLYPGGVAIRAIIRLRLPSGRYSSFGKNAQVATPVTPQITIIVASASFLLSTTRRA